MNQRPFGGAMTPPMGWRSISAGFASTLTTSKRSDHEQRLEHPRSTREQRHLFQSRRGGGKLAGLHAVMFGVNDALAALAAAASHSS
jgi:hypothetical protein